VIVNGDIIDDVTARAALAQSGADAVMIARGTYGKPWIASAIDRALETDAPLAEPDAKERLAIALDHFRDTLNFYGDAHGVRIFRKHLGWYIENAPWHSRAEDRRAAKSALCRLTSPREVESALTTLWQGENFRLAA
jgi:tRNA-dihydrouridine synthase